MLSQVESRQEADNAASGVPPAQRFLDRCMIVNRAAFDKTISLRELPEWFPSTYIKDRITQQQQHTVYPNAFYIPIPGSDVLRFARNDRTLRIFKSTAPGYEIEVNIAKDPDEFLFFLSGPVHASLDEKSPGLDSYATQYSNITNCQLFTAEPMLLNDFWKLGEEKRELGLGRIYEKKANYILSYRKEGGKTFLRFIYPVSIKNIVTRYIEDYISADKSDSLQSKLLRSMLQFCVATGVWGNEAKLRDLMACHFENFKLDAVEGGPVSLNHVFQSMVPQLTIDSFYYRTWYQLCDHLNVGYDATIKVKDFFD